jgi:signal transduction histidine kinase
MAVLVVLGWQLWRSYRGFKSVLREDFRLQELRGTIVHLDEVLTMSARMAAATGDPRWEARYRVNEPLLASAIEEAQELAPEEFLGAAAKRTDIANVRLVEMENRAFDLVRRGEREAAKAILGSAKYDEQKREYASGMDQILSRLQGRGKANLARYRSSAYWGIVQVCVALVVILFIWLNAVRLARAALREYERAEARLRRERDNLTNILDSMQDGVYIASAEYDIEYVNPALRREFGPPEGRKCYEYFHERTGICPWCKSPEVLSGNTVRWQWHSAKTGKTYDLIDTPLRNPDGSFSKLEIFRDITDLKRAEEERRQLEAQIQHTQRLESLGVLAGGIAHDFNNLLTVILGNTDLALRDTPPGSPAREMLSEVKSAASRASVLTNQMLAYSGRGAFVVGTLELSRLVEEMGQLLHVSLPDKVQLELDLAADLPAIEADASQVHQIVMNLVTNAAEAIGDESGVITVHTCMLEADRACLAEARLVEELPEGPYVCLQVSDTGCGMDAETQAKLFDPFFTTKFVGRGLGLAAVHGIVRGHRGAIRVRSEVGKGTTVTVLLPYSAEAAAVTAEPLAGQSADPLPPAGTVLVVEDEPGVRDLAKTMLERAGFVVLTAGDGEGDRL